MNFLNIDIDFLYEMIVQSYNLPKNAQTSGLLSSVKPVTLQANDLFIGDKPIKYPAGSPINTDSGFNNPANFTTTGGFNVAGNKLTANPGADGEWCQQDVGPGNLPDEEFYLINIWLDWNSYTSGRLDLCFDTAPFISGDEKTILSFTDADQGARLLFKGYHPNNVDCQFWRLKSADGAVYSVDVEFFEIKKITSNERKIYFGAFTPGGNPQSVWVVKQYGKTLKQNRINMYDNASSVLILFDELLSDYDFHGYQFVGYEVTLNN